MISTDATSSITLRGSKGSGSEYVLQREPIHYRAPIIEGLRKEPNMFHNYETEKITCKASDTVET